MYKHASMNKVYRIVWNEALGVWQAVGEWGSGVGKATSLLRRQRRAKRWLAVLPSALMVLNVWANPTGMEVISGSVQAVQQGNILNITNSDKAVIHWQQFNIGVGETTHFIQPSASSSVLNRVVTANPSQIMGNLTSNGQVYLINPSGILVGKDAQVDVAAFVASTLNISDANFAAGVKHFSADSLPANVTNLGAIRTPNGGQVYLLGGSVDNQGNISAPNGDVIIAAGQQIQITDTATPGVSVLVPAGQVNNLGKITADAGRIGIAGAVINNTGSIKADSVVSDGGKIRLVASNKTNISGEVSANGATKGGNIDISAPDTTLTGAIISAEGADGGQIRIGGEYQGGKNLTTDELPNAQTLKTDKDTVISVNATSSQGKGGTAVLWSDKNTTTQATVKAKGGAQGQGGLVEISSGDKLVYRGKIENSQGGQVLFDPKNIIVSATMNSFDNDTTDTTEDDTNTITATSITEITDTGASLILQANNDITVDEAIVSNNTSGNGGDITLQAGKSIFINANITTDGGKLTLKANDPSVDLTYREPGLMAKIIVEGNIDAGTGDVTVIRGLDPETPIPTPEPVAISIGQVTARNLNITSSQGDEYNNKISLNGKLTLSGNLAINEGQLSGAAVSFDGDREDANLITGSMHINAVRTSFARNTNAASAYIITRDLQFLADENIYPDDPAYARLNLGYGNATVKAYGADDPNSYSYVYWLGSIGSFVGETGHIQTTGTITFDAGSQDISIYSDIIRPKNQSLVLKTTGDFTLVSSYDANISGDNTSLIRIEANTLSIGDEYYHGNLSANGSGGNIELVANNFFFNDESSVYSESGSIRLISKAAEWFHVNQALVNPLTASTLIFESHNDLKLYGVETGNTNLSFIADKIEVESNNVVSSQAGNISLLGNSEGVLLREGSQLKTASGNIRLDGHSQNTESGVTLLSGARLLTTASGDIDVIGSSQDYGIRTYGAIINTGGGNIDVFGKTLSTNASQYAGVFGHANDTIRATGSGAINVTGEHVSGGVALYNIGGQFSTEQGAIRLANQEGSLGAVRLYDLALSSSAGDVSVIGKSTIDTAIFVQDTSISATGTTAKVELWGQTNASNSTYNGIKLYSSQLTASKVILDGNTTGNGYGVNVEGNTQLNATSAVVHTNAFRDISSASGGLWGANTSWQLWLPTTQSSVYVGATNNYSYTQLSYDYTQYGASYGDTDVLRSGKGILFAQQASISGFPLSLNKVYDGNTSLAAGSQTLSLGSNGSVNLSWSSGEFTQRHVGNNIGLALTNLSGSVQDANNKPAYGYSIIPTSITGNISQRESVTWTGSGGDNNWFNAANWQDGALPDGANVAKVYLTTGASVRYNAVNLVNALPVSGLMYLGGETNSYAGALTMQAGELGLGSAASSAVVKLGGLDQQGGKISGNANFNIAGYFYQASGSQIILSSPSNRFYAENMNQTAQSGVIEINGVIEADEVEFAAQRVQQNRTTGSIKTEQLTITSHAGVDIQSANNVFSEVYVSNDSLPTVSASGDVRLATTGALTGGILNEGGDTHVVAGSLGADNNNFVIDHSRAGGDIHITTLGVPNETASIYALIYPQNSDHGGDGLLRTSQLHIAIPSNAQDIVSLRSGAILVDSSIDLTNDDRDTLKLTATGASISFTDSGSITAEKVYLNAQGANYPATITQHSNAFIRADYLEAHAINGMALLGNNSISQTTLWNDHSQTPANISGDIFFNNTTPTARLNNNSSGFDYIAAFNHREGYGGGITINSVGANNYNLRALADIKLLAEGDIQLPAASAAYEAASISSIAGNVTIATNAKFVNHSTTGIQVGSGKQYWVYSANPSDTVEGMTGYRKRYNQRYSDTLPDYATTGNWFFYSVTPTITVGNSVNQVQLTYGDPLTLGDFTYTGFIDGDTFETAEIAGLAGFSAPYNDKGLLNAGNHTITLTSSQSSSLGYEFIVTNTPITATVTPKMLTISGFSANNKIYDGTSVATYQTAGGLNGLVRVNGVTDDIGFYYSDIRFDNKNVGENKQVRASAVLAFNDLGNYRLASETVFSNAAITAKELSLTGFDAADKVYDGTTSASIANAGSLSGVVQNDQVMVSNTGASFDNKHAGTAKTVTLNGIELSGADAANYSIASTVTDTADITQLNSVTWTGSGGDNNWFNAANWQNGALPDGANVASVVLPNGVNVLFDIADQSVYLHAINSTDSKTGSLILSAGSLNVTDLYLDQFRFTGGTLNNSRLMTKGDISILLGSSASPLLSSYLASSMSSEAGNVSIETYGGLTTGGLIQARNIRLTTHSPLVIGADGLTASEAVSLSSPDGDISITGNIAANSLTATASDSLIISPSVRLTLASAPSLSASSVSNQASMVIPTEAPTQANKPVEEATNAVTQALTPTNQAATASPQSSAVAKVTPVASVPVVNTTPSGVPALPAGFSAGGTEAGEFGATEMTTAPSAKQTTNEASSGNQQSEKGRAKEDDKKQRTGESSSDGNNNAAGKGKDKKDKPVAACAV